MCCGSCRTLPGAKPTSPPPTTDRTPTDAAWCQTNLTTPNHRPNSDVNGIDGSASKLIASKDDDDGIEIFRYAPRRQPNRLASSPPDVFTERCRASVTLAQTHVWDARVMRPLPTPMHRNRNVTYFKIAKAGSKYVTSPGMFDENAVDDGREELITFVREPVARVFSAYGEVDANYNARAGEDGNLDVPPFTRFNHVPRTNSTSQMICRFDLFLDDVFSERFLDERTGQPSLRYWWPNHAYPMILAFLYYRDRVTFVGKVETMVPDWERLRGAFPHLPSNLTKHKPETDRSMPYDEDLLTRLDNRNENGKFIKRWVVEVERRVRSHRSDDDGNKRRILEKLCCLYLPDFVCFGYDLPLPECHCDEFRVEMVT